MGLHLHHARRQLRRDCEDLVGWSVALRAAQPDSARFLDAWVPLASRLHRQARALDHHAGHDRATRIVAEACDAVLADIGFAPLPCETYCRPGLSSRARPGDRSMAA